MLAWMGYAMLAAAALGVTAWLIDFAVAGRQGRRRVLWAGVLLASAVGPIVFSLTGGIPTTVVAEKDGAARAASGRETPIVSDRVLGSAWLGVSAIVSLWLVATQRRLRRRLRDCPLRIVDGERVRVSSGFGPAVVGVVRPQIVLPEWALAMRESDRRIIVAHETEHRRAHDPLIAAAALAPRRSRQRERRRPPRHSDAAQPTVGVHPRAPRPDGRGPNASPPSPWLAPA